MPAEIRDQIRIVAFPEGDGWVAHCVEYDIVAHGADLPSVKRNITAVLRAECRYTTETHGEAFANIPPAPDFFGVLYEEAEESLEGEPNFRLAA
jgi:hypothetical protein